MYSVNKLTFVNVLQTTLWRPLHTIVTIFIMWRNLLESF